MCIVINININQPHLFLGSHRIFASEGQVILHPSMWIGLYVCWYMMEHSFTINSGIQGYHFIIQMDRIHQYNYIILYMQSSLRTTAIAVLVQWQLKVLATLRGILLV